MVTLCFTSARKIDATAAPQQPSLPLTKSNARRDSTAVRAGAAAKYRRETARRRVAREAPRGTICMY